MKHLFVPAIVLAFAACGDGFKTSGSRDGAVEDGGARDSSTSAGGSPSASGGNTSAGGSASSSGGSVSTGGSSTGGSSTGGSPSSSGGNTSTGGSHAGSGGSSGSGGVSSSGGSGGVTGCESVGATCSEDKPCPAPRICNDGVCTPAPSGTCGGIIENPCDTGQCIYCSGCSFGFCFTPAEIQCICSSSTARDLYDCPL